MNILNPCLLVLYQYLKALNQVDANGYLLAKLNYNGVNQMCTNQLNENKPSPMKNSNWATLHFQNSFSRLKTENKNLEPDFYFLTAVFNKAKTTPILNNDESPLYNELEPEVLWRWFTRLYVKINMLSLGRNYHRKSKRHLQPLTYGFVDAASSKLNNLIGWGGKEAYKNPHIHSVMMIHPEMNDIYRNLFIEKTIITKRRLRGLLFPMLQSIDIQSVSVNALDFGNLETVNDYSSKYLRKAPRDVDTERLWDIYPKSTTE